MATRSYIGVLYPNNVVVQVYCHYDGYPAFNGVVLQMYHNTQEKAEALIKRGSLSCIGRFDYDAHNPNPPAEGIINSLTKRHADLGDYVADTEITIFPKVFMESYAYLYSVEQGDWIMRSCMWEKTDWRPLSEVLQTIPDAVEEIEKIKQAEAQGL